MKTHLAILLVLTIGYGVVLDIYRLNTELKSPDLYERDFSQFDLMGSAALTEGPV
jgi:hypothetical protein